VPVDEFERTSHVVRSVSDLTVLQGEPHMSTMKMQHTRDRLARIYGVGIAVFSVIVGFITLGATFLSSPKLD
jgi:hypothetical protein